MYGLPSSVRACLFDLDGVLTPTAEVHDMDTTAVLVHRTKRSGLRIAAVMDHSVTGSPRVNVRSQVVGDFARVSVTDTLEPGQRLRIVKLVAYGWSAERTVPALRDQVAAAIEAARVTGWDGLLADQRRYLDDFWSRADVVLEGDVELQQAVRFALFHVLQAAARAEGRGIPAKGLTGTGYDGHSFWDCETFILPVLVHTVPAAAADVLRWRHSTLPIAREHARALHLQGAAFPWRTIHGEECSGYWPGADSKASSRRQSETRGEERRSGRSKDQEGGLVGVDRYPLLLIF